jgi:hypothetical protein
MLILLLAAAQADDIPRCILPEPITVVEASQTTNSAWLQINENKWKVSGRQKFRTGVYDTTATKDLLGNYSVITTERIAKGKRFAALMDERLRDCGLDEAAGHLRAWRRHRTQFWLSFTMFPYSLPWTFHEQKQVQKSMEALEASLGGGELLIDGEPPGLLAVEAE